MPGVVERARSARPSPSGEVGRLRVSDGVLRPEREEDAGRAEAGRGRSVMRLPAAREGPAPGGAAAGPGRVGSEGSAERGDGEEVAAPFHPLPPSGPAPALPPELRGELALSFRRPPVRKVGPAGPDGPALWRVAEGLLPAVASAQEVPGADAQLRKTRLRGRSLPSSPNSGLSEAGPARGAPRPVVGRRRCGDARGQGRAGRGAAASRERPEAIRAGPGGTSPLLPSSRPPRSELGPEQRGPPLAAGLPGTRTRGRGRRLPEMFSHCWFCFASFLGLTPPAAK